MHSLEYANLKEYMHGWKHGCGSAMKLKVSGPYADGYEAGLRARMEAQQAAIKRYNVSETEMRLAILRTDP